VIERDDGLDDQRAALLAVALDHVPWDGWSDTVLDKAVRETGVQPSLEKLLFPKGAMDLVHFYSSVLDRQMLEELEATALEPMKIRARIMHAVRTRLELAGKHREAARRAAIVLALPQNLSLGAAVLYETVDAMWHGIGDTSTDFNFYTKRATLAGVYAATLLFWLGDDSGEYQETWGFLSRRIEDVMRFEKVKARARAFFKAAPSPAATLGSWRYPNR